MNRFNRDYALVRDNGEILAESHDADRLHTLRYELTSNGISSTVVASDLPRSRAAADFGEVEGARAGIIEALGGAFANSGC